MAICKINSLDLYYEIHGSGEPILFLHGLGSSTQDWEKQVPDFVNEFKVYLLDLRGHGKSEKPQSQYSLRLFAQDVEVFIAEIISEPVHLVGLSLGALVACNVAVNSPSQVKSLTLVNCPARLDLFSIQTRIQYFIRIAIIKLFGMKGIGYLLAPKLFPQPEQKHYRELFIQRWNENNKNAYLKSMQAMIGWNIYEFIDRINCTASVISAEHDYFALTEKKRYVQRLKNAEHIVIKNTHHALPFEKPEEFNKALYAFLKKYK